MIDTKHWLIEGTNEWHQIIGKFNWYTATLINLYFEKDDMTYGYEFIFTLLGLGFRIRYNTTKALDQFDEWANDKTKECKTIEEFIGDCEDEKYFMYLTEFFETEESFNKEDFVAMMNNIKETCG